MPPTLPPSSDTASPDALLEHFLEYVAAKGIELYPAQEEAMLELYGGSSVILNTPTGSGKSLVAAALHYLSASLGRKSVYTCPIKALVNEKFLSLCKDFGPENVGMMTGDASVNRDAPILCCTAEILANIALRDGSAACLDDVIMDEFHYYSDPDRGVAWQAPLLTLPHCRFLLMSATLGGTGFFEREIERHTGQPCVTVSSDQRPVPLDFTYVEDSLTETLEKLKDRNKLPAYLVHFTQRAAADTAQSLLSMGFCTKEEKACLTDAMVGAQFTSPFGADIKKLLRAGIGLHHAGLLPRYRVLIEKLAQQGLLKVICGTDTLGVGVNVPIRTVLFTQLCKFNGKRTEILSVRDFKQIAGRAGRKGFDDQGFVIAMAPEHVIENRKAAEKAAGDPKKQKKLVKKSPPSKGYIHWDEETFKKLQAAPPEPLQSNFRVDHGMLLNVLSRNGDGCRAMQRLIRDCHEPEAAKREHLKHAWALFRSLLERDIVEILPRETGRKLRVNLDLQDDFSLNQTLGLYLIDALGMLDTEKPDYPLKVISLAEAILENPDQILRQQLKKLKDEKVAEMKAAGIEYEERMEKLEELEHPKPEREFIYETFNAFAEAHPWVGEENIKPKSIAREMFESYSSFADYIKKYGLKRSEGLLLRHLTSTYRVLSHTVPDPFKTEPLREAVVYFKALLEKVDSSLLEEWEALAEGDSQPRPEGEHAAKGEARASEVASGGATYSRGEDSGVGASVDPTRDDAAFTRLVRNEVFAFVRLLANQDYQALEENYDLAPLFAMEEEQPVRYFVGLESKMQAYFEEHGWIRLDPAARAHANTRIDKDTEPGKWIVEQTLVDPEQVNDWFVRLEVYPADTGGMGAVRLKPLYLGS